MSGDTDSGTQLLFWRRSGNIDVKVPKRMATWRKSLLAILLIGIVVGVVGLVCRHNKHSERMIEGRPLSEWVRELGNPNFNAPAHEHAREALAMQPPAIIYELLEFRAPTRLTARLQRERNYLGQKAGLAAEPVNWDIALSELWRIISQIAQKNGMAWEKRPEAQAAVDALIRQLKADPTNAPLYSYRLAAFGVNATNALPTLIALLPAAASATNSPQQLQMLLTSIADIGPGPYSTEVIRAAANLLGPFEERNNMEAALRALGACGTNAAPLIPQIVERLNTREEITRPALIALAEIDQVPPELKARLVSWMESGSGPAAVAMLEIDPKEPTAINIVQARLHPSLGLDNAGGLRDHTEMIQLISRVPKVAKLFIPELEKLSRKTNVPTAYLAKTTLRRLAAQTN